MNPTDRVKLLGKKIRRLSSITDYITECEIQLGLVHRELADDACKLKTKIRELQQKIENYKEHTEANIRWERMMKEENDNYNNHNNPKTN